MDKSFILQANKVQQILGERRILADVAHPFIMKAHWAFQSVHNT